METRQLVFLATIVALVACSAPHRMEPMGPSPIVDPNVVPFHAESATSWPDFRLGGGLNVVVVNPRVPRYLSWRFSAGDRGISSSPVVYRDQVLIASNDRNLYDIDAATGTLRWRYLATDQVMAQPVYADGLAIVAAGGAKCTVCMPPDYVIGASPTAADRISAVDLETGREHWGRTLAGTGMPTPAIVGSSVVHADGSGAVLALDARTAAFRWVTRLPSVFAMSSVVDGGDGRLYVSGVFGAAVYALRASNGALLWTHRLSKFFQGPGDGPMASTKTMLVAQYLQAIEPLRLGWTVTRGSPVRHHIFALDMRTGRLLWDRVVDTGIAPPRNKSAIPLIYGDRIYEGSPDAAVMSCLNLSTGKRLWQIHTAGPVKGGIVAVDGVLYFGDLKGYLWAVDAKDGRVVGRLREDLHFNVGSPIVLNGSLIDGSREGVVIAVPLHAIRNAHDELRTRSG